MSKNIIRVYGASLNKRDSALAKMLNSSKIEVNKRCKSGIIRPEQSEKTKICI